MACSASPPRSRGPAPETSPRNLAALIALTRDADARGVDLVVFPELSLSSYALDDLHLQDAMLDAVETALGQLAAETAALAPVFVVGAPLRRNGRLYNTAVAISPRGDPWRRAQELLAQLPRILRETLVRIRRRPGGARYHGGEQHRAVRD